MGNKSIYKLLHKLPYAYVLLDGGRSDNGKITDAVIAECDDVFAALAGQKADDLHGKLWLKDVFPEASFNEFQWLFRLMQGMSKDDHKEVVKYFAFLNKWFKIYLYCPEKNSLACAFHDITREKKLRITAKSIEKQQTALHEIISSTHYLQGNIYEFISLLTEKASGVFDVWRVGVWFFDADGEKLRCYSTYDAQSSSHSSGMILSGFKHNDEFYYLRENRFIASEDAQNDERLAGYIDNYLIPLGITSMLDVGISPQGSNAGILCIEDKGKLRKWDGHEINFACQLADQIAIVLGIHEKKLAENRIRKSQQKLESLLLSAPLGMGLVSNRVIMEVNDFLCNMTGYSRDELIGKNARMLYHSDEDYESVGREKYNQIKTEGKGSVETRFKTKAGKNVDVILSSAPIDRSDWSKGVTFTVTDITERKKTEQKLQRNELHMRQLAANIPGAIYQFKVDQKGNFSILFMSDGGEKIFEKPLNQLHDSTRLFEEVLPDDLPGLESSIRQAVKDQSDWVHQFAIKTPAGKKKWLRGLSTCRKADDGALIWDGVLLDVTTEVQKQQLEQNLKVALQSAEFKRNFLANMSHEMRTPLTGIIGMTEILSLSCMDGHQQEYLKLLQNSGEQLMKIIDQVLDFSKIEQGKETLIYERTSINELFSMAENFFRFTCKKKIDFSVSSDKALPEIFLADKHHIAQVLQNLLSNAIKFTHLGNIAMETSLVEKISDDTAVIKVTVKDTGVGIAKEKLEEIFKPFSQLDINDTRKYDGTGLGLSISEKIVEMHGGQMGVESQEGQGSIFWFTLAVGLPKKTSNDQTHQTPFPKRSPQKLKILFAEDKLVNQKVVKLLLNSLGHEVILVNNGEEAVNVFPRYNFDLILLDIQMPVMDGITAMKKLREIYGKIPPVIGLSANAFEGDKEKYIGLGLDEYITKPVKKEHFQEIVKKFF